MRRRASVHIHLTGHQEAFAKEVPGVVTGKPIKDLKVDKIAGASWTSDAFNARLG